MATAGTASDAERQSILNAAVRVMRRNGYAQAQIGDILAEAELSTRAFYRHFESKDDLLLALYRADAAAVAARLRARVAAAATPQAQLEAWVDETLSIGYDRRRADRAAMLGADVVRRTAGFAEENARANAAIAASLREVLAEGTARGAFPRCVPDEDAPTIHALTWRLVAEAIAGRATLDEDAARAHVRRFCLPALGVPNA